MELRIPETESLRNGLSREFGGDEYILLNIMNIGNDYTRGSKPSKDGMFDIWEKGDHKIYIKVLYLDL